MDKILEQIADSCKQLRISKNFASQAMIVDGESNQEYLLNLLLNELEWRKNSGIEKRIRAAGFPVRYVPSQYKTDEITFPEDASFESIMNLDFYNSGENLIMYGGSGTGKTMLSILVGIEACRRGINVSFFRTASLINRLSESHAEGSLGKLKKKLDKSDILILDEFGYVPYDRTGAQLLFDYLSETEGQKIVILNTNLEFAQWVNVLYDPRMTTALIGRLTHHVQLILFPGNNNRLRESSINSMISGMNSKEA